MRYLKDNLLLLCLAAGLFMAWLAPGLGQTLAGYGLVKFLVFFTFVLLGFGLDSGRRLSGRDLSRALGAGFVASQVAGPLLGMLAVMIGPWHLDDQVGFVIKCCMAPTFVSGAILAQKGRGDFYLAVVLAIGVNALAVFSIPYALAFSLGAKVDLQTGPLLLKLMLLVLLPALTGQALRRIRPGWVAPLSGVVKYLPQYMLGLVIYLSISPNRDEFSAVSAMRLIQLLAASIVVHGALLAVAYASSRWVWRLSQAASRSVAMVCAQKSLPLAVAVWTIAFASLYPGALVAAMVFHPTQIIMGGVLATWWARRVPDAAAMDAVKA